MKTVLFIISMFTFSVLTAQNLIDEFGGVRTHFTIVSNSTTMDIIDQVIVHRSFDYSSYESSSETKSGMYDISRISSSRAKVQVYQLEFMSADRIPTIKPKTSYEKYYKINFYDGNGKIILNLFFVRDLVKHLSNDEGLYTYSINLKDIPFVILDRTKTIEIIVVKESETKK